MSQEYHEYERYIREEVPYVEYTPIKTSLAVSWFAIVKSILINLSEIMRIDLTDKMINYISDSTPSNEHKIYTFNDIISKLSFMYRRHRISNEEFSAYSQNIIFLMNFCYNDRTHVGLLSIAIKSTVELFKQHIKHMYDTLVEIYENLSKTINNDTDIDVILRRLDTNDILCKVARMVTGCRLYDLTIKCLKSEFNFQREQMNDICFKVSNLINSTLLEEIGYFSDFLLGTPLSCKSPRCICNDAHLYIRPDLYVADMDIIEFIKDDFNLPLMFQFNY